MQQSEGGLFPHPRHPRDVVARVPHQGLEIDELGGRQPVFFPDGEDIVGGGVGAAHFGRGQQHRHLIVPALEGVPVPGRDEAVPALLHLSLIHI